MLSPKVAFARQYAIEKHGEQKYGIYPYVKHLDDVHQIVVEMNLGEEYEIAAYLHDVLEDCDVNKQELEDLFGKHITEMVFAVSGFGENRAERQKDMKTKMALYPDAINLKMADRLANIKSSKEEKLKLYDTYKKEHESLSDLFKQGLPALFQCIEQTLDLHVKSKLVF